MGPPGPDKSHRANHMDGEHWEYWLRCNLQGRLEDWWYCSWQGELRRNRGGQLWYRLEGCLLGKRVCLLRHGLHDRLGYWLSC